MIFGASRKTQFPQGEESQFNLWQGGNGKRIKQLSAGLIGCLAQQFKDASLQRAKVGALGGTDSAANNRIRKLVRGSGDKLLDPFLGKQCGNVIKRRAFAIDTQQAAGESLCQGIRSVRDLASSVTINVPAHGWRVVALVFAVVNILLATQEPIELADVGKAWVREHEVDSLFGAHAQDQPRVSGIGEHELWAGANQVIIGTEMVSEQDVAAWAIQERSASSAMAIDIGFDTSGNDSVLRFDLSRQILDRSENPMPLALDRPVLMKTYVAEQADVGVHLFS